MKPLISVILPIYKVEAYLRRAVDSVRKQTYKNLEIILVEDGSPDGCGAICEEYVRKDQRIKAIHKENGGLSDARNAGIEWANGEYIAFLDADDYIASSFIEVLYEAIINTNSDLAFCKYLETTDDAIFETKEKKYMKAKAELEYNSRELCQNMYAEKNQNYTCFVVAWNKLYKRSLWENIRFPKGKIHEDEATTYRVFDKAGKGVFVPEVLYAYYQLDTSITRKPFSKNRLDCLQALEERTRFYLEKQDLELAVQTFKTLADTAIVYYRIVSKENKNGKDNTVGRMSVEKEIKQELKQYVLKTVKTVNNYGKLPFRTTIGYYIFLLCPKLYYVILKETRSSI